MASSAPPRPRRGSAFDVPDFDGDGMAEPGATVLMTVQLKDEASLAGAARFLGIAESAIDTSYGLVPIDPEQSLYAVRISAGLSPEPGDGEKGFQGPYSDPKIAPMR
jgi:hypothetical protein